MIWFHKPISYFHEACLLSFNDAFTDLFNSYSALAVIKKLKKFKKQCRRKTGNNGIVTLTIVPIEQETQIKGHKTSLSIIFNEIKQWLCPVYGIRDFLNILILFQKELQLQTHTWTIDTITRKTSIAGTKEGAICVGTSSIIMAVVGIRSALVIFYREITSVT